MDDLLNRIQKLDISEDGGCTERDCFVCTGNITPCEYEHVFTQQGINFDKYEEVKVRVTGPRGVKVPGQIAQFSSMKRLTSQFERLNIGYDKPTPIQKYALPILQGDQDMVGCAQTGSGKTAGFLIPMICKALEWRKENNRTRCPFGLIVAPTRELAQQILLVAGQLTKNISSLKIVCVYGGVYYPKDVRELSGGVDILIGTTGRLLHLAREKEVDFSSTKFFVIDEGDHMLDSTFIAPLRAIQQKLPSPGERQTAMFCATLPDKAMNMFYDKGVDDRKEKKEDHIDFVDLTLSSNRMEFTDLIKEFLEEEFLFVCTGEVGATHSYIEQNIIRGADYPTYTEKRDHLVELLKGFVRDDKKTIVFVELKSETTKLAKYLCKSGFDITILHSDLSQDGRQLAFSQFNSGSKKTMVCTSVSARGLDVHEVFNIVNFELPSDISTYLYRIGRSGRAGNCGKAYSFFDESRDKDLARSMVKNLAKSEQEVPDWLEDLAENALGTSTGLRGGLFGAKDTRNKVESLDVGLLL